jgi:hypothetical protein
MRESPPSGGLSAFLRFARVSLGAIERVWPRDAQRFW